MDLFPQTITTRHQRCCLTHEGIVIIVMSSENQNQQLSSSCTSDFELQTIVANGIIHRVATLKGYHPKEKKYANAVSEAAIPRVLILLLHGWPEGWYSWQHQLRALGKANFAVCAPDMRGFGGTAAPPHVRDYRIDVLCRDVISVAAHPSMGGYPKIIPIGHDFGAYVAWHLALLHPESVVAVCGMSVPFLGHSPSNEGVLSKLQSTNYGRSLPQAPYCASPEEQRQSLFQYMLYHNLEHAAEQFDLNAYEALYRTYYYRQGVPSDPPNVTSKKMFPGAIKQQQGKQQPLDARSAVGMWDRAPRPRAFPSWTSEEDFEYMLQQYRHSGFAGGLNWYKVMDANWAYTKPLIKGKKIHQPALFVCGKEDFVVLKIHGGLKNVVRGMEIHCNQLLNVVLLDDTGHWCQQEQPERTNLELFTFMKAVTTGSLSKL